MPSINIIYPNQKEVIVFIIAVIKFVEKPIPIKKENNRMWSSIFDITWRNSHTNVIC